MPSLAVAPPPVHDHQQHPLLSIGNYKKIPRRRSPSGSVDNEVIIVMGATGTGKSWLAIDLAASLGAEIINSDKMQVYEGLDVVTNKVTDEECKGVPHHLMDFLQPNADFTPSDFRAHAIDAIDRILSRGSLPIVAGGSNNYIEALVDGAFRSRYRCCFLWVDVGLRMLDGFVSERVDRMVGDGLLDEVRQLFDPDNHDYSRGLRRAIGVPEMDAYLRAEAEEGPDSPVARCLLDLAIAEIKANTCALVRKQLKKIQRLRGLPGWHLHRLDATEAFCQRRRRQQHQQPVLVDHEEAEDAWGLHVASPASDIVARFLIDHHHIGIHDQQQMLMMMKGKRNQKKKKMEEEEEEESAAFVSGMAVATL